MPPVEVHTKEGFPAVGRCNLDLAVDCVSPEGLRGFARTLFVSGPEFSRDDLTLYLTSTVVAAWKALAAASPAAELCTGDGSDRVERELRGRLRQLCFDAGLELLAVRSAEVECPDFESIRSEQADVVVEEQREHHDQHTHLEKNERYFHDQGSVGGETYQNRERQHRDDVMDHHQTQHDLAVQ